jgi:hypothetical protein
MTVDDRKLYVCHLLEAEDIGCVDHGTHFGVEEVAVDPKEVTDGFHSFDDLYEHRRALTVALFKAIDDEPPPTFVVPEVWRSKEHHPDDSPMLRGYFVVGVTLPELGQISYHYELAHWSDFDAFETLPHAPKWDGHTSEDVVERLLRWGRL